MEVMLGDELGLATITIAASLPQFNSLRGRQKKKKLIAKAEQRTQGNQLVEKLSVL